jgi:long-chain acyl-CoA synthetase
MDTVAGIVRTHGADRPDGVAVFYSGEEVTWGELDRRSNAVAQALRSAGVVAQSRIARIDKNSPEYFEVLFGAAKLNAVLVDVNWRLSPPEMAQIINDAGATVLFVGTEFLAHLDKIQPELHSVRSVVVHGEHPRHPSYVSWLAEGDGHGVGSDMAADPGVEASPEDVALQLYTSGTTGLPKGVMLTNLNLFTLAETAGPSWGLHDQAVPIVVMPMFHIAGSGFSLIAMAAGAPLVLHRQVDPAAIVRDLAAYRVTTALFVPSVLQFLLDTPGVAESDFGALKTIIYGASPITDKTLTRAMATFGCGFLQVYGLTETTGTVTRLAPEDHDPEHRPGLLRSCGQPIPRTEIRIVDANGDDVAEGDVGEVLVRSPLVMKGYWNKPDETARAMATDGWLRTGDAAYRIDGYLYLHDRLKDMIVSGGENVYPAEVENALAAHPAVAEVGVIGVPDDRWGETVKAVVVRVPGSEVTAQELMAFTRQRLAAFKRPTSVDFVAALPRTPSGKILKRELREPYWAGRDRRIG